MVKIKIPANIAPVKAKACQGKRKVVPAATTRKAKSRSKKTSLEKTEPARIPRSREALLRIRFSQNITRPTWRFSSPKMPYRPNSFFRPLIKKLLMYTMKVPMRMVMITCPIPNIC